MAQYQSFPDASGDSRTLEKLKALKLPDLEGRSFLDVGCNEGFFCGFAKFLGASRSLGVDHSKMFIERAIQRFPDCEFRHQTWDKLPEGPFDVILLASALHYATDQPELVHRLVESLSADGVLILELGIVSSNENAWVDVERGIDTRQFPTMAKLREILSGYAWKWMGRSVSQDGDPVMRHVVHISRRRPAAYLLMQPPAYGKSSIASRLFPLGGTPVVSGDQQFALIAQGSKVVPSRLKDAVRASYSPYRIDETTKRIFDSGAGRDLVSAWAQEAGGGDFALDAYVPENYHALVKEVLVSLGYFPVHLQWERLGPRLLPAEAIEDRAETFYMSMATPGTPLPERSDPSQAGTIRGYVDELAFANGRLTVRGWAVGVDGTLPATLGVRINGTVHLIDEFEEQERPDVRRHLHLPHASVGYRMALIIPGLTSIDDILGFGVFVPSMGDLNLTSRIAALLAKKDARTRAG